MITLTPQEQLNRDGFRHIMTRDDPADFFYPDHLHAAETAHLILSGEMTLIVEGKTMILHAGERFDVPANAIHSARIGLNGCRFLVGEKSK